MKPTCNAKIRPETPNEFAAIAAVTRAAFADHPRSSHTEEFIVAALRAEGSLVISLVAEVDGTVVGHIAFSPVAISDGSEDWYGLGPISVAPDFQNRGIGSMLVRVGLEQLMGLGAAGCVLLGEPAFYTRFGFVADRSLVLEGVRPAYFLSLRFGDAAARGTVTYSRAFSATD